MWRLTVILPRKSNPEEVPDPMSLSAVNTGVSNQQMQSMHEEYIENPPRPEEMTPFDENVIMQTPVRHPSEAVEGSPSETQEVLF